MNVTKSKIQEDHLQRQAYVYVRQSTLHQVRHHLESQRRQYALQEQAVALGWAPAAVIVVDEEQAWSGQVEERPGFQRLRQAVARGEVGALFSLDISRLIRQNSAWVVLLEVCRWQQTLLIDEEHIYDPHLPDDRLLLGLRGLMVESELETLRQRMRISREEKARRGELRFHPPTGLVFDPPKGLQRDPDEEVQGALQLLFDQFQRVGNAAAVVRYFEAQQLLFPTRHFGGVRDGEVEWQPLTYQRTLHMLHNPLYAGAYVYGRRTSRSPGRPRSRRREQPVLLPEEEWQVVRWDTFAGYLSHEEYEANQQRLAANRPEGSGAGTTRAGPALLSRLIFCGQCGRPMQVLYAGTGGRYPSYVCRPRVEAGDFRACQKVPAGGVDASVVETVLQALTPATVELSLQVLEEVAQQQEALHRQWERRLERARYEADLAQRRYQQVDPENRLVVRTLERDWEERLQALAETEQAYRQAQQEAPLQLSEADRQGLLTLAQDLPALWAAESTTEGERKEILRLLIADVTLTRQESEILVQLRWVTNEVKTCRVPLPERGVRTDPAVIERLRELSATHTDAEIAAELNRAGMQTARGQPFTAGRVSDLRRGYQIVKVPRRTPGPQSSSPKGS